MTAPLRVLFVEDDAKDVDLLVLELRRGGFAVTQERVDTPEGFAAALEHRTWDLVLCDYRMPHFSAPEALAMAKERDLHIPFIVVSGIIGEEAAVEALRAGAHDFMTKGRLSRLLPAIDRELREAAAREEHRQLRQQLMQAQKMEAIGQFAGGIAHDFNNLLTVISGYVGLAMARLAADSPIRLHLAEVERASERAKTLVRQILTFSRRQIVAPRVIDLNAVMAGMEKLLRPLIGADIDFLLAPGRDLGRIRADPGQVEQVLMNLAANARDAMPEGGRLVFATGEFEIPPGHPYCRLGLHPGPHVLLAVTDTGIGMDEQTQAHIFEPFFTTKGPGKGTGLGLATAFGIARQSGGGIFVESKVGRGTTIKVYFPRVSEAAEAAEAPETPGEIVGGLETILLVEDQAPIRALAHEVLREHGYRVLDASGPELALALAEGETEAIDLLLADMVMPGMSGAALSDRLVTFRPRMRTLLMSGYATGTAARARGPAEESDFLPKPFTADCLLRRVRKVLDAPQAVRA